MVLFYFDFDKTKAYIPGGQLPSHLIVERKQLQEEVNPEDLKKMVEFWNPKIARRDLEERFAAKATLWLIQSHGRIAGYGWTMVGRTLKPHYYPFGVNDVHLFDFLVFPEYRGRGINPLLVGYILGQCSAEGRTRAYIEVAEWNQSQLTSLRKTGFQYFGVARKRSLFGRTIVEWGKIRPIPTQGN